MRVRKALLNNAKIWSFISIGIGLLTIVLLAVFYGAIFFTALSEGDF